VRQTVLAIQTDPVDELCRLGEWLGEAGLSWDTARPDAGGRLPTTLDRYAALIVLGAEAPPAPPGARPPPWLAGCAEVLREAVRRRIPTLAIGTGAHLLTTAHGGAVGPGGAGPAGPAGPASSLLGSGGPGPELGPRLVARRDVAERDPLFARVPFAPDVVQWHHAEITRLPDGAVLLAASTRYPHQAYRLGDRAWALQFHIEPDAAAVAAWAARDAAVLAGLGADPAGVTAATEAVLEDLTDVWQPFAARFAGLVRGEPAGPHRAPLPLLGG
jgi:GMP synthase-like glutamine amidotransferase